MIDCATAYTYDFVVSALPHNARRVLEIGCGDGRLAALLLADGLDVVAIDSDPEAIAAAHARRVEARLAAWPEFAEGRFDAILFTRSLHHVGDLRGSLDAAFAALVAGGRLVIEDFMAEGGTERSDAWFHSLAAMLDRAGVVLEPTEFLLEILGRAEPQAHDHDLHPSSAIEAALRERAKSLQTEAAAYYFRYLLPAVKDDLGAALLNHELALIAAGSIDPLGRRYVAFAPHSG